MTEETRIDVPPVVWALGAAALTALVAWSLTTDWLIVVGAPLAVATAMFARWMWRQSEPDGRWLPEDQRQGWRA